MASSTSTYFVFMNFDPEYARLRRNRAGRGELNGYLVNKHDNLLARFLEPNTYRKKFSMVIVDGFSVDMNEEQAELLRSMEEVRLVEKNQELD